MYSTRQLTSDELDTGWPIEPMLAIMMEAYKGSPALWGHVGRVARYAMSFGQKVGIRGEALMSLQCAALLHEVGKSLVDADLLAKDTTLERDEWYSITKHTTLLIRKLKQHNLPGNILSVVQSHSERFDGSGYPLALSGDEITEGARVLSIADSYDTMSIDRPYRLAHGPGQILAEFESGSGTQFDPDMLSKVWPLLAAGQEAWLLPRSIQLISKDLSLFRQLWFAVVPHGWDLQIWSADGEAACPPELVGNSQTAGQRTATLVLVDGSYAAELSAEALAALPPDAIWIGQHPSRPMLTEPLDLRDILALLYSTGRAEWSRTPAPRIKTLLADPYHIFRQVLRRYLDGLEDIEVVAEVSSPQEYRTAILTRKFDVAIIASDLFSGTHTTSPLKAGDLRLEPANLATGPLHPHHPQPTIILVADEDADDYRVGLYDAPLTGNLDGSIPNYVYIHRGAPAERLVEAIKAIANT